MHEIKMIIPYTVSVQAVLKKDNKRITSKKKPILGGKGPNGEQVKSSSFEGEILSVLSVMVIDNSQNSEKPSFLQKNASIILKITKGDKSRSVGIIHVNLADYIDNAES